MRVGTLASSALQKTSARYWTCRHRRREKLSIFVKRPGGRAGPARSGSKWFGVKASGSRGSSNTFLIGQPLTVASTFHVSVGRPSSSKVCSLTRAAMTFLTVRIHRSHSPLWWDPASGLKVDLMPFAKRNSWILSWFHSRTVSRGSFSPFTKFSPLLTPPGYESP